jgi:hypothetical protein
MGDRTVGVLIVLAGVGAALVAMALKPQQHVPVPWPRHVAPTVTAPVLPPEPSWRDPIRDPVYPVNIRTAVVPPKPATVRPWHPRRCKVRTGERRLVSPALAAGATEPGHKVSAPSAASR